jgi:uncharacterized membrane protein YdcZ (DUF606 family)
MYNAILLVLGVTVMAFGIENLVFTCRWWWFLTGIFALFVVLSSKCILPYLCTKKTLILIFATGLYLLIVMVTAFATAYTSLNELRLPGATSLAIVGVEIVVLATTGHSL